MAPRPDAESLLDPGPPSPHSASRPMPRLREGALALGLSLTDSQLGQFARYLALLLEWNQRFNLTAIAAPDEVIDKHFLDSLSCATIVDLTTVQRLADVGTGPGFPGVVLKIAYPHLELLLLDSVAKRLRFLDQVVESLGLEGVTTCHARAEDAGRDPRWRERCDLTVARAVARLNTLAEYCLPLTRVGGRFLAQKGPQMQDELAEASPALRRLGGGAPSVTTLTLPGTDLGRSLIVIPKVAPTPPEFPRLPGTPKKHPL
jgi:16S rRNA (guanine527-N7)-methyltransferase